MECCCFCSYCPRSTSLPLNPSRISTTKQQFGPTPTTSSYSAPKGSTASPIQWSLSAGSHKSSSARSWALHLWRWLVRTLPVGSQRSPLLRKTNNFTHFDWVTWNPCFCPFLLCQTRKSRLYGSVQQTKRWAAVHAEVNVPHWLWVLPHVLWAGEERTVWSERDQTEAPLTSAQNAFLSERWGGLRMRNAILISSVLIKANMFAWLQNTFD